MPAWRVERDEAFVDVETGATHSVRLLRRPRPDVWHGVAAPVLLLGVAPRVLILGHGAGTVTALVHAVRPRAYVVGVDPDPAAWDVARRWGQTPDRSARYGAAEFLKTAAARREQYDLVIDDAFIGFSPVGLRGFLISRVLAGAGVAVFNRVNPLAEGDRRQFRYLYHTGLRGLENQLCYASQRPIDVDGLVEAFAGVPVFAGLGKKLLEILCLKGDHR